MNRKFFILHLIWSPYYNNKKQSIERVQNNFLRFLYYKKTKFYSCDISVHNIFDVPSLKCRRDLSCSLFFYLIILIDCSDILNMIQFSVRSHNLRNSNLFMNPLCKFNYVKNFSLYRFYDIFNRFSKDPDTFYTPFNAFKNLCKNVLIL